MEQLIDKVGFITGGASGIGLGIAKAFVHHGMKVIIADSRQDALDEAMAYFSQNNQPVHPLKLDVRDRESYANAADEAEAVFDKIHILVNNAGVAIGGLMQDATYKDWDFNMGVNIGGVINGVVTILPRILKHGEGGHVVATSSTAGLFAVKGSGLYCTAKFAVAGMMESLATDLQGTGVGASVLIPGAVRTNLGISSAANRPDDLKNEEKERTPSLEQDNKFQPPEMDPSVYMDPVEMGERVVRGIKRNDLFIITHPEFKAGFNVRNQAIICACPDDPIDEKRLSVISAYETLVYNPIYEKQTTVGNFNK